MQQKSRPKETLQQKVDRLNGYHVNEHDWLFDRLFSSLRTAIARTGKRLVYRDGLYVIEEKEVRDAIIDRLMIAPSGWLERK